MNTYACIECHTEVQGLDAAVTHRTTRGRHHEMREVKPVITGFSFESTKRDGSTSFVTFGDLDGLPLDFPPFTVEDTSDDIAAKVALVFASTMTLDDKINLVHTICHSVKYAGLVKSATI